MSAKNNDDDVTFDMSLEAINKAIPRIYDALDEISYSVKHLYEGLDRCFEKIEGLDKENHNG